MTTQNSLHNLFKLHSTEAYAAAPCCGTTNVEHARDCVNYAASLAWKVRLAARRAQRCKKHDLAKGIGVEYCYLCVVESRATTTKTFISIRDIMEVPF